MKNWSHETIGSQKFNGVERCRKACGDCGFRNGSVGWKSVGIDRNWESHWLQTSWRRRDASQLLAKHILSPSCPGSGRLVFLWPPPRRPPVPRSPIKSRLLVALTPYDLSISPLHPPPVPLLFVEYEQAWW